MYGLPCCVMLAASPPVKFGISALLRLGHADDDRAGEHRPHHDIGAVVDRLLRERLGDLRIRLRVAARVVDLAAQDAAGGVDLLDRELDAVVEVGAGRRAGARQLDESGDLDRLLREAPAAKAGRRTRCGDCFMRSPPVVAAARACEGRCGTILQGQRAAAYCSGFHPPPSAFAKSTMDSFASRAAAMRSVSAASSWRCASITSRNDVRPAS